jgi:hypothetical protein
VGSVHTSEIEEKISQKIFLIEYFPFGRIATAGASRRRLRTRTPSHEILGEILAETE